eukprot:NODE_76_length_23837_cov_1.242396.p19 type:complete len:119 gc:universal NODE_76_length_23837_cov_1.242396:9880-10236(+)
MSASHVVSYLLGCSTVGALGYFYLSDEFQVYANSLLNTSKHLHLTAHQLNDVRNKMDFMGNAIDSLSITKMSKPQVQEELRSLRDLVHDYHVELNQLNTKFNAMQKELFWLSNKDKTQ